MQSLIHAIDLCLKRNAHGSESKKTCMKTPMPNQLLQLERPKLKRPNKTMTTANCLWNHELVIEAFIIIDNRDGKSIFTGPSLMRISAHKKSF